MTDEKSVDALPKRIGSYRIIRILGEGGMGTVYEAEQDNPRRTVALKVVKPGIISSSLLSRFKQESQVLGRLQHPGIGQIYDAGAEDAGHGLQPYFAMELIEGPTLVDYVKQHRLGTRQRLKLLAKVCDAVHHAHQKGIIHRDLKPDNILVDETGQPKILDFGVARCTDSDIQATLQTDIGQLLGTIPYMSPEQVVADPDGLDTRSDVYALGVILYEVLTERLPYDVRQKMIHEAVRVIREEEPRPLRTVSRVFRGDVETILSKTLEKDRERRYPSAAELASDIRRYLRDEPIVARPPSALYQIKKFTKRHKSVVVALSAVFLILVAGTMVSTLQAIRATRAETAAHERQMESEAVTTFLQDMLSSINPHFGQGREVTVREVLDEAAEKVEEGALSEQPLVEAAVRATLGRTYRGLGLLDMAVLHLGKALEIQEARHGPNHMETADSRNALAWVIYDLGDYDETEKLAEQSLSTYLGIQGDESIGAAECTALLAHLRYNRGDFNGAAELQRKALATNRKLLGEVHFEVAELLGSLAFTMNEMGNFDEAESLGRESLKMLRSLYGNDHPEVVGILNNLSSILKSKGDYASAEKMLRESLAIARRIFDPDHQSLANSFWRLGDLLLQMKNLDEAEPMLREALAIRLKKYGEEHRDVVTAMTSMATLLKMRNDFDGAEAIYRKAMAIRIKLFGEVHPAVASSLQDLGKIKRKQKKPQEAEAFFRKALAQWKETLGVEDRQVGLCMNLLALALQDQRDFEGSEAVFREQLERVRRLRVDDKKDLALAINNLGSLLYRKGEREEAESLLREALVLRKNNLSHGHPEVLETMGNLAYLLEGRRDYAAAEPLHREFLELAKNSLPEGHLDTAGVLERLGSNLGKQGKWAEAESVLQECLEILIPKLGPDNGRVSKARRKLNHARARME